MMKRTLCAFCAIVIFFTFSVPVAAFAQVASSDLPCGHNATVRQYAESYRYVPKDGGHVLAQFYVDMCSVCFQFKPGIVYLSQILSHVYGSKGDSHNSSNDTHSFYYVCKYCNAQYATVTLECNADTTGVHVTYSH